MLAGKYRVERVLGVGGMGIVVEAKHLSLDERVALKFLRERVMDQPDIVVRFLREARAVAKLKSDHVVRVRDVGNLDSGAPYIVMELLEGETLKERVKREGALHIRQSVDYVLQACDAIAEAHSHGIIHRDLKPTNLFLSFRPDGRALVKVIDFGISKVQTTGAEADAELGMTATTSMLGSPLYMSPEQMVSARNVDVRTDIWSLGVTLYVLISGVQPFKAETMPQVCALVLGEKPKRLDEAKPGVPRELADVVARCLEKDPAARFSNIAELASALEPFGSEVSRGAALRVSSMLRVPAPPPSSRSGLLTVPSGTTITQAAPVVDETDVSFGEASRSPPSRATNRSKAARVVLGAIVLAAAGSIALVAFMRGAPRTTASATPGAPPPVSAPATTTAVPAADPKADATDAGGARAENAAAAASPKPAAKPRPLPEAQPAAKPKPAREPQPGATAFDPNSYR